MIFFFSVYFSCRVRTSFLRFRLCFACFHSSPIAISNPRPRNPLIPVAMAIFFLDDGAVGAKDELDTVTVAVAVTVLVAETVSALSGDVEPDVRL